MRIRSAVAAGMLAALFLLSATAGAQPTEADEEKVTASLRAGVSGYTGALGQFTGIGYAWGLQASERRSPALGLEAAYEGSSAPITDTRLPQPHRLVRNGVQGLAKLYPPLRFRELQPFVGVGFGLSYVDPTGSPNDLYTNGLMAEVPLAAGVEYQHGTFSAGARLSFNPLIGESFASQAGAGNPNGSVLEALFQAGARF